MMHRPSRIVVAIIALLSFVAVDGGLNAQTRKKKAPARKPAARKSTKARPKPPAPPFVAVGATLEQRLASLVNSPVAANSVASIQIVEVESGRVVAERNAHMPVAPASNMKLFTTGAGLDLLEPDFEFRTTLSIRGKVESTGTLRGDVKITGRGDPTIGSRFHDGNASAVVEHFAAELQRAGIKSVAGNLIFEYGYFDTEWVHSSWPADQLVNWYEAPVAALTMQEGCVMIRVLPAGLGQRAIVEMEPPNSFVQLENTCVTSARRGRGVFVGRQAGTNKIIVRGNVPARSGPTEIYVTVMNPVHYFANVTHDAFQRSGLALEGRVLLVGSDSSPEWKVIGEHKTPIDVVNFVINKKSQNHYAEQLLKTIGAETKKDGSFRGGSAAVTEWLTGKVGVPANEYVQIDGSGMSRFNRASANAFTSLLRYMWKTPHRHDFVSSMPYSGEDESRLRKRLNQPPYERAVYAKTGYISGVIGLSGYIHAQSGKIYAFSFLFNQYRTGVWGVYGLQDQMLKEVVKGG